MDEGESGDDGLFELEVVFGDVFGDLEEELFCSYSC